MSEDCHMVLNSPICKCTQDNITEYNSGGMFCKFNNDLDEPIESSVSIFDEEDNNRLMKLQDHKDHKLYLDNCEFCYVEKYLDIYGGNEDDDDLLSYCNESNIDNELDLKESSIDQSDIQNHTGDIEISRDIPSSSAITSVTQSKKKNKNNKSKDYPIKDKRNDRDNTFVYEDDLSRIAYSLREYIFKGLVKELDVMKQRREINEKEHKDIITAISQCNRLLGTRFDVCFRTAINNLNIDPRSQARLIANYGKITKEAYLEVFQKNLPFLIFARNINPDMILKKNLAERALPINIPVTDLFKVGKAKLSLDGSKNLPAPFFILIHGQIQGFNKLYLEGSLTRLAVALSQLNMSNIKQSDALLLESLWKGEFNKAFSGNNIMISEARRLKIFDLFKSTFVDVVNHKYSSPNIKELLEELSKVNKNDYTDPTNTISYIEKLFSIANLEPVILVTTDKTGPTFKYITYLTVDPDSSDNSISYDHNINTVVKTNDGKFYIQEVKPLKSLQLSPQEEFLMRPDMYGTNYLRSCNLQIKTTNANIFGHKGFIVIKIDRFPSINIFTDNKRNTSFITTPFRLNEFKIVNGTRMDLVGVVVGVTKMSMGSLFANTAVCGTKDTLIGTKAFLFVKNNVYSYSPHMLDSSVFPKNTIIEKLKRLKYEECRKRRLEQYMVFNPGSTEEENINGYLNGYRSYNEWLAEPCNQILIDGLIRDLDEGLVDISLFFECDKTKDKEKYESIMSEIETKAILAIYSKKNDSVLITTNECCDDTYN